jgi:DNA-binding Lrp family transcriptional regulator
MKNRNEFKADKLDHKILHELQADNTITYRELSERVALSPSACMARVTALEKAGIIEGYHAQIEVWRIQPVQIMIAEITLAPHQPEELAKFEKMLRDMPEVVEVQRLEGPVDYLIRTMLPSVADWKPFARRILSCECRVQKMITHVVMQEIKPFAGYPLST